MDAAGLITALGGDDAVAAYLKVRAHTVRNYRRLGVFPPRIFLRMEKLGEQMGVSVDRSLFVELPLAARP
jgi:hypothetical protein